MGIVELAKACDLDGWMRLVEQVRDSFPGLETQEDLEEHRKTVLEFMNRNAAICAKREGRIVGALLFSKEPAVLCFLAVDDACRRQHIGERMVSCMRTFLDPAKEVSRVRAFFVFRLLKLRERAVSGDMEDLPIF